MADTQFYEAVNQVIGTDGDDFGLRYAVNHDDASEDSTAGATAIHDLDFKLKMEADPSLLAGKDISDNYPAVYFDPVGNHPDIVTRGQHGECTFVVNIYVVAANTAGVAPKQAGRTLAAKVAENIRACDRLNLVWIDDVEVRGLLDDPFTKQLHLLIPSLYAGGLQVVVYAKGLTW